MPRRFVTFYLWFAVLWLIVTTGDLAKPIYHYLIGREETSRYGLYIDLLGYGSCLVFIVHYFGTFLSKWLKPFQKRLAAIYLLGAIGVTARIIHNDLIPSNPDPNDRVSFTFAGICFIYLCFLALMLIYGFWMSYYRGQRRS